MRRLTFLLTPSVAQSSMAGFLILASSSVLRCIVYWASQEYADIESNCGVCRRLRRIRSHYRKAAARSDNGRDGNVDKASTSVMKVISFTFSPVK